MTAELRPDELAGALAAILPPGSTLDAVGGSADITIVGVSARPDDVLVRFRWLSYPYVLGFGLRTQWPYLPVDTAAEWAVDAQILLLEEVGTGLVARGTRVMRSDFIELSLPDWPHDRRYYVTHSDPSRSYFAFAARDGFDVATPRLRKREGSLVSWQRAFVNSATGEPMVGHATVSRVDADTGRLDECEVIGAPASVSLALCWAAVHRASWHGLRRIVTDLDDPVLDVLGFTPQGRSRMVDTTFLSMDHEAAAAIVASSADWRPSRTAGPAQGGRLRDAAFRHLAWRRASRDPELDELVLLFADKLRSTGMLAQTPVPEARRLVVQHRGHQLEVALPEGALRKLLADGDELAADLWGPNVSAREAAARLLTVHLDESLDTAGEDALEGTWTYDGGFFTRSGTA